MLCARFGWNLNNGSWDENVNKRPMGHIAHLREQFKSINTYDYVITLIKRRKKTLLSLWQLNGSLFNKIESHSPKFGWNWPHGSEEDFFNFVNIFRNNLPLEKGGALHLNKLEFVSRKGQVWLKLAQWFLRRSRK